MQKAKKTASPVNHTQEMQPAVPNKHVPLPIILTMLAAVALWLLFVLPYIGTILFSILVVFIFNPVYRFTLKKTQRQGLSIGATIVAALLAVLIPFSIVIGMAVNEVSTLTDRITNGTFSVSSTSIDNVIETTVNRANETISNLPGVKNTDLINTEQARKAIIDRLSTFFNAFFRYLTHAGELLSRMVTNLILAVFLIAALLRYQSEILRLLKRISPFDDSINDIYLQKMTAMTKAMLLGQFVIAIMQGLAGALSLWIIGIDYFVFLAVLLSLMSFIPLGSGIITLPLGLIVMFTGDIWQGLFVIAFHVFVVTNIDNVLRPRLVPKSARLNSALLILSVFCGLSLFGALGVFYGPVVMIALVTTFNIYASYVEGRIRPSMPAKATRT